MSEWKKVKLGEICEITSSKRIFFSEYVDSGIPFYRSKEIIELSQGQSISEPLYISESRYNEIRQRFGVPEKNDILLTSVGSIGIPYIVNKADKFYFKDGNLTWFRNYKDSVFPLFILYWLKSNDCFNILNNIALGAAQKALTIVKLKEVEIPCPPLDTQQRIATILSRYDSLIENYQKQIKLLEESAQRLYKEWFVDLHFPGHENTKIVNGVPEGWEKKTVGDIVKIKSGFAFKSKDWQKQGCPVVKIKDISGVFVNTDSLDYVSSNVVLKAQQYLLNKMDLVIAMTGATIGKIGLITDDGLYANQRVGKFFLQKTIDVPYLYCFFKQAASIEQIVQISSASSAQPNISGGQLESFEILFNVNIIKEYNLKCYKYFRQMIHLYSQIHHLTEARDRLLPKLMSGEIEV